MEHYLGHTDYPIWEVIQKGNGHVQVSTYTNRQIKVLPPNTAEEILAIERKRKARNTLLMAIPEDHLAKFHKMTYAKEMWEAIKSRFGLHKGYDRFQSLLIQLEIHGAGISTKDANQKFLGSLPASWSQVSLITRTKPGVDTLSFNDFYNNLRVFESDVKGSTSSSSSTQNVVFISSESTSSTNEASTTYAKDNGRRPRKHEEPKDLVTLNGDGVDWTGHSEDEQENFALMAYNSSGSDTKVTSCSKECKESYAKLKKLYNEQGEQFGDASIEIQAYDQALKKGFGSVFDNRSSDLEDSHVNDRYVEGMHAVPPPMTGIYMPPKSDFGIDKSMFTYGPKQSKTNEFDAGTSNSASCEFNYSVETLESIPKPVTNESKAVSKTKVWSNAPIIEEYESDSNDEHVTLSSKEQEKPSFAFVNTVKHVKTPRQTLKEQNTCSQNPKPKKRDWNGLMSKKLGLGYRFTKKACFVCGSFSHLIRNCDFHKERMTKQVKLNKQKGKSTGPRENRPVWNNVQRLNHKNKFVPTTVLTKTDRFPINVSRQKFSCQITSTSTARKVSTAKPVVNKIRPRNNVYKSYSPIKRPFNRTTSPKDNFSYHKVNTAGNKIVSAVGRNRETAVNASADCNWRPKRHYWNKVSKYNSGLNSSKNVVSKDPLGRPKKKAYLVDYQDYNGGPLLLEHFNLFSVLQMCDKKNKVLFTDIECLVLSPDFRLPDENQ
nr:xylulose kinase-1 [Tanacetum cinerariifolium]